MNTRNISNEEKGNGVLADVGCRFILNEKCFDEIQTEIKKLYKKYNEEELNNNDNKKLAWYDGQIEAYKMAETIIKCNRINEK